MLQFAMYTHILVDLPSGFTSSIVCMLPELYSTTVTGWYEVVTLTELASPSCGIGEFTVPPEAAPVQYIATI